jgi:pimeloyl-ACP methyl ester carboxylesterase
VRERSVAYRERSFTSHDGLALYFRDYGDPASARTPILCLGGLTRNSKDFHETARRLAATRRVLCPDYRGRGRSAYDPDPRRYRPATYLRDIADLLAATNVHRVAVIGTSLGGLLAMALSASLPAALAGVVLNDIGPDVNANGLAAIIDYIRTDRPQPDWESAVRTIRTVMPKVVYRDEAAWTKMVENTFKRGDDGLLHFDWDVRIVEPLLRPVENPPDLWALFRGLRHIPVLAIRGAESDILLAPCFERMAGENPDLVRLTLPGVGHAPTLLEPEAVAAIDDFLARL